MDMRRHASSSALSDCSLSSGFQSMLGSPINEPDIWADVQELENRVKQLECGIRHKLNMSSTPGLYERSRHDSASSSCSTVIDSSHSEHATELDANGKLLVENNLTLTEATLDSLRKFSKVEVRIAIVGTEMRGPQECTCLHGCNQKCSSGQESQHMNAIYELQKQLEKLMKENMQLKQRAESAERFMGQHPGEVLSSENGPSHSSNRLTEEFLARHTGEVLSSGNGPPHGYRRQETGTGDEEESSNSVVEYSEETSKAEIEELKTSQKEKTQKFCIMSVVDPTTKRSISYDDAVAQKIICLERGIYMNSVTGEEKPIEMAMRQHLINVDSKTTHWGNIRESSVGIMTIRKNRTPTGTLLINEFKNTQTGEMVSKAAAIDKGITDSNLGRFKDLKTGQTYSILEAIEKGHVTLHNESAKQQEVMQCVYKVSGIVDKRTNEVMSFSEAVMRGILVQENGLCKDTATGKYIYVGFALISGLMQVDPIENGTTLDALQC